MIHKIEDIFRILTLYLKMTKDEIDKPYKERWLNSDEYEYIVSLLDEIGRFTEVIEREIARNKNQTQTVRDV